MSTEYQSSSHSKFLIQYHIIWCPKYRFSVLKNDIRVELKRILIDICSDYDYTIKALEIMPDHIHIFLSSTPSVAPSDIVRILKSLSAIRLFRAFPSLKAFYGKCGKLWSRGYFISTIGYISEATVQKYIENQYSKARK